MGGGYDDGGCLPREGGLREVRRFIGGGGGKKGLTLGILWLWLWDLMVLMRVWIESWDDFAERGGRRDCAVTRDHVEVTEIVTVE